MQENQAPPLAYPRTVRICFFRMTRDTKEWEGGEEWHPQGPSSEAKALGGHTRAGAQRNEHPAHRCAACPCSRIESRGLRRASPTSSASLGVASGVWRLCGPGSQMPLSLALPASPKGQRAKERLERALGLAGFSRKAAWRQGVETTRGSHQ